MSNIQSILITGANAGLGRESARQFAQINDVKKIYLACRNKEKALAAKAELEAETGRSIFEIILIDVMDLSSVRKAVANIKAPIDAIILNAGGTGGTTPRALTADGVTNIFAVNLLGHTVFVDKLLKRNLINSTVLYAGSEAARGIPKMGIERPHMETSSTEEFSAIANGTKYGEGSDPLVEYGAIKLTAAYWMAAMARKHKDIRFITVSPGGTSGTNGMDDLPFLKKIMFKYIGGTIMPLFGMMHGLDVGAKRYVDTVMNETFKSGHFYASKGNFPTGELVDQTLEYADLDNPKFEDNAYAALLSFA
ncbi:SDR family NAD(P)-dependent oxidoreductase [Kordiimonas sp. SCSIO 12603]|uniref:SDR family NAD(P)-dependent oxidoreductase n=1 Tax=Kordiimonas sp. SCSIO 12603 TaxID=2829596 RepID=UPI002103F318|nr:SDR family NAD(P)-dependent oxidoreductase [Kordiimonas sp. SCSIO 12603]UTW59951.1 SDR family NAD(P)-dependent oxidoreductase [Kordiimonas sp. SCSIO 12603]